MTPVSSPQKDKYGDRFIPSRAGNNWAVNFNMIQVSSPTFSVQISSEILQVSVRLETMAETDVHCKIVKVPRGSSLYKLELAIRLSTEH